MGLLGSFNLVRYHENAIFPKPSLSYVILKASSVSRSGPLNIEIPLLSGHFVY